MQPVIRVYRIKLRGLSGQIAYRGNVISIDEIIRWLPRIPSTLRTIVVRRKGLNEHREFYARRNKIIAALTFLKANNPYYADIQIDVDRISQLRITQRKVMMFMKVSYPRYVVMRETEGNAIALSFINFYKRYSEGSRSRLVICRKQNSTSLS